MKVYYSEFEATRKYAIGWDVKELSGEHKSDVRRMLKNHIDSISNGFLYYEYPENGYFLYYDDYLKQFICVQASAGKKVDDRDNMILNFRVPEEVKRNGFWECMQLICMWKGKVLQKQDVAEICEKYRITTAWLDGFASALYEQAFSVNAKSMQIVIPSLLENEISETEFVMDMMQICYALIPASKWSRLSFGWNIPEDKLKGMRILFHKTKQLPKNFELTEEPKAVDSKFKGMISRIVQEVLYEAGEERFQDKIDKYYIEGSNYESLYWNYCHYLLEQENEFTFSIDEYKAIREDLKKQIQNQFEKADVLFEHIVKNLLSQELKKDEYKVLLLDYLAISNKTKEHTEDALETLWKLILGYAEENEKTVSKLLDEIKRKYTNVYQPLMKRGISKGHIDFDSLILQEKLLDRANIDLWIEQEDNKFLLEEETVKEKLLGVLAPFFEEQASVEEIKLLIQTGSKIDKEACFTIFTNYMKERVVQICKKRSMLAYAKFMQETQPVWSTNSCSKYVAKGCEYLALACEMPVDSQELCAFTEGDYNLSNMPNVQKILLKKCREYLEADIEKNPQLENDLQTLVDWETGLSANDAEFVLAKKYLKTIKGSYEADDFLKEKDELPEEVKEVVKTERALDGEQFTATELITFLKKILSGKVAQEQPAVLFQILWLAEEYLEEDEMSELVDTVWGMTQVNQFPSLYKMSLAFQKGVMKEELVKCGSHSLRKVYEIYYDLNEDRKIKYIVKHMEEVLDSKDAPYGEELLQLLIWEWPGVKDETFEKIEQVLRIRWDDTEELIEQAAQVLHSDLKVKRIRERMQKVDSAQGKVEQLFSGIKAKFTNEKKGR